MNLKWTPRRKFFDFKKAESSKSCIFVLFFIYIALLGTKLHHNPYMILAYHTYVQHYHITPGGLLPYMGYIGMCGPKG